MLKCIKMYFQCKVSFKRLLIFKIPNIISSVGSHPSDILLSNGNSGSNISEVSMEN